jgi:hypothetical protein
MPCYRDKEKPQRPLFYAWSAAWPCKPKDNIVIHHKCPKPVKKPPNFMQKNKEAIANYRQVFLMRAEKENKMGDGFKLRAKASKKDLKCASVVVENKA